ncbi:MAG: hypothetical protein PVG49_01270, partial [Desulfobacteraceae bacterium]
PFFFSAPESIHTGSGACRIGFFSFLPLLFWCFFAVSQNPFARSWLRITPLEAVKANLQVSGSVR